MIATVMAVSIIAILAVAFWFEASYQSEAQAILCFGVTAVFIVVIGINFV